ncbi:uncharacterized protein LOC110464941 isoform X2 [Mizuhopecten yessoensis]|uniref:Poly(ADP-ribose) glycohydrolase ARH3 n=1 Tax=Mizuhopecten yessoensis TaxID=6573 RepID=A0A210PSP1_MIZYE|nr:uncharacterized protein LOC110464941 isoform X2 [Mizuhopecten yessoensis]OWF39517.1 hypothetical protein KP79_PYT11117 [Mizuhopecten yessoensis]
MASLDNKTNTQSSLSNGKQTTVDGSVASPVGGTTSAPEHDATSSSKDSVTGKSEDGASSHSTEKPTTPSGNGITSLPSDLATDIPVGGATQTDGATASPVAGTTDAPVGCTKPLNVNSDTVQRILGTIFGQCTGDAIGLLTEFMAKEECKEHYKAVRKELEYSHKIVDYHRTHWTSGDWTDDSDQMILIFLSIIDNNGKVDPIDFARRIKNWGLKGFPELGNHVGMGQGRTTHNVINKRDYLEDPFAAAIRVWTVNGKDVASNGAVMRTSILGVHMYADIDVVVQNAITIARTTHADPRCRASTVSVCVAVALMLQRKPKHLDRKGNYKIKAIIDDCYDYASQCLETDEKKKELKSYLKCTKLKDLKLDEEGKIGYTYKTMGAGFWALKQENFRKTITKIIMEGGDADTNACVAGALLGCKYGVDTIPKSWKDKLIHKEWLEAIIDRYFRMMAEAHDIDFTPYWSRVSTEPQN